MYDIQSLSFRFSQTEDRIVFVCQSKQVIQPLLLTRRLAFRLLGRLCEVVAEQNSFARQAGLGWRDDVLSITHAHSVARVDQAQQELAAEATDQCSLRTIATLLLTRIDLQLDGPRCSLLFFSQADAAVCRIQFSQTQLHWFVSRLHKFCHKADWGCQMPEPTWLQDDKKIPPIDGQPAILH